MTFERYHPDLGAYVRRSGPDLAWFALSWRGTQRFRAEPCPRCAITTLDQRTGARGEEPLRTLATYLKSELGIVFGRKPIHDTLGTVRVGDPVQTTAR